MSSTTSVCKENMRFLLKRELIGVHGDKNKDLIANPKTFTLQSGRHINILLFSKVFGNKLNLSSIINKHVYFVTSNLITRVSQKVFAHNFYNLFQQQQRPYNYIIFQHSPLALQYTCSNVPEASGCPQKKMSLAEQQATHSPLSSLIASPKYFDKLIKSSALNISSAAAAEATVVVVQ